MQDKIIAAIAAYLDEKTTVRTDRFENFLLEFKAPITGDYKEYLEKLAREIATAIAPPVEAVKPDWRDAPGWANYKTVDSDSTIMFWEHKPIINLNNGTWYRKSGKKLVYTGKAFGFHKLIEQRPK